MKKVFLSLSLVAVIFAAALRSADFLIYFDEKSGFFANGALLSYIAAAICLIVIISGGIIFTKKLNKEGDYKEKKNIGFALVSIVASLGFFYAGYELISEYTYVEAAGFGENTALGISMRLPLMVLTFITGAYFVYAAAISFMGKCKYMTDKLPFMPMVTVLWSIIFTLFIFMHYSVTPLHSENLFLILSAVFGSYSFLQYAGFVSGVDKKRLRRLFISGLAFVSVTVSYCVSDFVRTLKGVQTKHDLPLYLVVLMLSAAVVIGSFILTSDFEQKESEISTVCKGKRFAKK